MHYFERISTSGGRELDQLMRILRKLDPTDQVLLMMTVSKLDSKITDTKEFIDWCKQNGPFAEKNEELMKAIRYLNYVND